MLVFQGINFPKVIDSILHPSLSSGEEAQAPYKKSKDVVETGKIEHEL